MMKGLKRLKKAMKDQSGQGATEYILLLVVVVAIVMIFRNDIKDAVNQKIQQLKGDISGFDGNSSSGP